MHAVREAPATRGAMIRATFARVRAASPTPKAHVLVCVNRRPEGAPLGPGCGDAGEGVYGALKALVARSGAYASVWITQTSCLGVCPKVGATVALYPGPRDKPSVSRPARGTGARLLTEVAPADAQGLFDDAVRTAETGAGVDSWEELEKMLVGMEGLQREKVLELARRLRPNVTAEDIRNPHDFPDLDDPDWQFEDGVLTGIESVLSAVRAERRGP